MDKTILKPRPGRRGLAQNNGEPAPAGAGASGAAASADTSSGDKTVVNVNQSKPVARVQGNAPIFQSKLVDYGADIFSLTVAINRMSHCDDVDKLKQQSIDAVKNFEQSLRNEHLDSQLIESARYCVCALLDETVLNTPWGSESVWVNESLLSIFHKETFGGEYFFTLLDEALRQSSHNIDLLELQYYCLNLGFQGKYRVSAQGQSAVDDYRDKLYREISLIRGTGSSQLSINWRKRIANGLELRQQFPLWVILTLFAALALVVYTLFSYQLNRYSDNVFTELDALVPYQLGEQTTGDSIEASVLNQLLQTEIQRGVLSVTSQSDRVRIRISSESLFDSGSNIVRADMKPIIAKIARALEGTQGKVLITGHTDNTPISTPEYPSNWHLSLARATQVANAMAQNASLSGRLWPEGRGEAEPVESNDTAAQRAKNRRIEIDLLF
ncbi:type VI secretion system protein TssL, long form [Pseudoalteromonas sp. MM17-2]|uniref:type VI secretion system protein TssL, long form n=1 Tax=Pseudoalteromonas sp. MM17-2 TaxID=2917753 RepID=UPI001EF52F72|nr:type VI secretion system protein TssL, long form [Pseudoalteromonas sp. MM17-2]MCG7544941.1 type VI secretion system protein TssL, long form [Pseudoalteromonas sp. MM17-2]